MSCREVPLQLLRDPLDLEDELALRRVERVDRLLVASAGGSGAGGAGGSGAAASAAADRSAFSSWKARAKTKG